MNRQKRLTARHRRRALHVRRTLRNDMDRPRLTVFRSRAQIYCQVIDDLAGRTLCAASTLDRELRDGLEGLAKKQAAARVGEAVARRALEKGITKVKFDRGWHRYHGRVKELADAARAAGLEF